MDFWVNDCTRIFPVFLVVFTEFSILTILQYLLNLLDSNCTKTGLQMWSMLVFSAGELWKRPLLILLFVCLFFITACLSGTFPCWYFLQFGSEASFRLDWLHIFNKVLHQVTKEDLWDSSRWNAWSVRVKEKKGKLQLLGWWPCEGSK